MRRASVDLAQLLTRSAAAVARHHHLPGCNCPDAATTSGRQAVSGLQQRRRVSRACDGDSRHARSGALPAAGTQQRRLLAQDASVKLADGSGTRAVEEAAKPRGVGPSSQPGPGSWATRHEGDAGVSAPMPPGPGQRPLQAYTSAPPLPVPARHASSMQPQAAPGSPGNTAVPVRFVGHPPVPPPTAPERTSLPAREPGPSPAGRMPAGPGRHPVKAQHPAAALARAAQGGVPDVAAQPPAAQQASPPTASYAEGGMHRGPGQGRAVTEAARPAEGVLPGAPAQLPATVQLPLPPTAQPAEGCAPGDLGTLPATVAAARPAQGGMSGGPVQQAAAAARPAEVGVHSGPVQPSSPPPARTTEGGMPGTPREGLATAAAARSAGSGMPGVPARPGQRLAAAAAAQPVEGGVPARLAAPLPPPTAHLAESKQPDGPTQPAAAASAAGPMPGGPGSRPVAQQLPTTTLAQHPGKANAGAAWPAAVGQRAVAGIVRAHTGGEGSAGTARSPSAASVAPSAFPLSPGRLPIQATQQPAAAAAAAVPSLQRGASAAWPQAATRQRLPLRPGYARSPPPQSPPPRPPPPRSPRAAQATHRPPVQAAQQLPMQSPAQTPPAQAEGPAVLRSPEERRRLSQQRAGGTPREHARSRTPAAVARHVADDAAVLVPHGVTVRQLASLLGVGVGKLEETLEELGDAPRSPEETVSPDSAELAALELGRTAVIAPGLQNDVDASPRPAVVTVMGHVDHGKTTLLDSLRKSSVAAGEAGGITQHIGAFEVVLPGSNETLTFLDTPGHAAFSAMRARGAAATDLVVLVVAADDGVMPQTREALAHARASGCPIVVAITKCDMPTANPARVRQQLLAEGVELEEAGGGVQCVEVAAARGQGLAALEEALLLQAEELALRASPSRECEAVVVEARMDKGQGPVATVIVKHGTLRVGQPLVTGTEWGKVRALRAPGGRPIQQVLPGRPAEVSGLRGMPAAGDDVMGVGSEERARRMSAARTLRAEAYRHGRMAAAIARQEAAAAAAEAAADKEEGGGACAAARRVLPLIVKSDVWGSAQAVEQAVQQVASDAVGVRVIFSGVGPITSSDVALAVASGATVVGFNVRPAGSAVEAEAKQGGVQVTCHRVIYHLMADVARIAAGLAPVAQQQVVVGAAEVLQLFPLRAGRRGEPARLVAGCRVGEGSVFGKGAAFRVLRAGEVVHEARCESLKRHKADVDSVGKGTECGVVLEGEFALQLGDTLQCVRMEAVPLEPGALLASADTAAGAGAEAWAGGGA